MQPMNMLQSLVAARTGDMKNTDPLDEELVDDLLSMQKRFIAQGGLFKLYVEPAVDPPA